MGFYQILSKYYDDLFPAKEQEMAFVNSLLGDSETLLDIGSGTGNKTAILAQGRRHCVGIDMDEKMVEAAAARHADANLTFLRLDMREMGKTFSPNSFDAAVCLGNTLAHLHQVGELMGLFRDMAAILKRNGVFIGQIINYDRIIDRHITELPVIETDEVVFRRGYDWHDSQMLFAATITDKKTGEEHVNAVPLRPILKAAMDGVLYDAGFGAVEHFGSYSGEPFTEDSYHLIFKTTAL